MFVSAMVFASGNETDIQLFNELFSSYNSGFYPGAVEYSNRLINEYPESAYAGAALVIQGECLVRLNEFDEALQKEQADVERLEKTSFFSIFYTNFYIFLSFSFFRLSNLGIPVNLMTFSS